MVNKNVDIIIPIYNAADDLEICLDSIYKHTDLNKNRLILINDNSPDPRIREILDKQSGENIIVIHNKKNQGFSANINIGMAQSENNDVLLLNSDTVVTDRWIEKILECAYSREEIGTVTPLSNNATLCSVPIPFAENNLPENISVDKMAEIVESCSLKLYPTISVGHGFCLFIKRSVIDDVGNFDAKTFEKGYGEENDFCNRAEQVGYCHAMCDNVFILHTGTKSFISAEKEALIKEHEAILRRRYPEQMHNNDVYVRDNPNAFIADNVRLNLIIKNGKKNILYVLHEDIEQSAAIGGTQMHVAHLCQYFKDDCNVFVANRVGNMLKVKLFCADDKYVWFFPIGELHAYYRFFDEKLKDAWQTVLNAFEIDLVHIHHLMGLSHDIIYVAKELGIPTVFTCHDYYMLTPSLTMLDKSGHIITREDKDAKDRWKGILEQTNAIYQGIDYLELWQKRCFEALKNVDRIIVPSSSVKERLLSYYPDLSDIYVVEHGYEINEEDYEIDEYSYDIKFIISSIKNDYRGLLVTGRIATDAYHYTDIFLRLEDKDGNYTVIPAAQKPDFQFECLIPYTRATKKSSYRLFVRVGEEYIASKNIEEIPCSMNSSIENHSLNIAFIGGINQDKGAEEVLDLIKHYKKKVNWFIFGGIGEPELASYSQKNCYKYGRYSSTDLPLLINTYDIDLICILSRCPETFSYTLSEAYEMGVPVIASNVGALKERIDFNGGGWLVDINDCVAGVSEILDRIISNRNVLDEKKSEIRLINLKNFRDMNNEYVAIYNEICSRNINRKAVDNLYVYTSYINNKYIEMGTDNKQLANYSGRIVTEEQFKVINSLTFKLVSKIRKIRFPGKVILWQLMNRRV